MHRPELPGRTAPEALTNLQVMALTREGLRDPNNSSVLEPGGGSGAWPFRSSGWKPPLLDSTPGNELRNPGETDAARVEFGGR